MPRAKASSKEHTAETDTKSARKKSTPVEADLSDATRKPAQTTKRTKKMETITITETNTEDKKGKRIRPKLASAAAPPSVPEAATPNTERKRAKKRARDDDDDDDADEADAVEKKPAAKRAKTKETAAGEEPLILFEDKERYRVWLHDNHAVSSAIWMKYAKKHTKLPSISYAEAIDVSLCYGWIDGQAKTIDESFYKQRYTPRKPRTSKWSAINVKKAEALIASGAMQPAGLAQVEAAKADGRWAAAYDSPSNATVPADLQALLDADTKAQAFFSSLNASNRYAITYRLQNAVKKETRDRLLIRVMDMLRKKETYH